MHLQTRVYIKTALIQLVISMLLGALLLLNSVWRVPYIGQLLPVYYHILMLGWVTQLIFGVALWLFPVLSREQPRGDERVGWFAYGALNIGLGLRAIAEPAHALAPQPWSAVALGAAAILQIAAMWALVIALWPRVKSTKRAGAQ